MSASARYYECIEDTFEEVENRLEALVPMCQEDEF